MTMSGVSPASITKAAAQSAAPTGARLLISALEDAGATTVFGYPGGAIMPVYDALAGSNLRHILVRHEQGAAFAADGWARVTGKPGVCLATSGPGATNLITGIANAAMDSVPMVAITGQVPTALMGTDAFQEVDILGMTLPIVKHSWLVRDAGEIPAIVAEAFHVASSGRPGPVLIDLPKDIAASMATKTRTFRAPHADMTDDKAALAKAEEMIAAAERPLLYVGGGVGIAGAVNALRAFARRTGIPAVATLKGLGALPTDDPQFLGMLGMHGTRAANMAVQECDLLIAVGARFDDRATGKLAGFAPHARVIHFDADASEIGKLRGADLAVTSDLIRALNALYPMHLDIAGWIARTQDNKARFAARYDAPGSAVYAPAMLKAISEAAGDNFVAACDVGQHQMWAAQHCRFSDPSAHLTSGGLGAMGFGIPAGIGAKLARPDANVVAITGDGSIMMNIQELATLKRYGIALKILLLDNSSLGLVRQWQELFYDRNYSEIDLSDNPDFVQVAKAFGIDAFRVERRDQQDAAIARLLAADGPCLAHVVIDPLENVWPLVPPGKSNHEMMHEEPRP
ncbi:MAG TPA: acetolactate synthase 2 catalytic subunit [Rhizomicrobium sp.]|jgi:acetolactate synthase-1/2/3 large subunit